MDGSAKLEKRSSPAVRNAADQAFLTRQKQ
jgi:hypothetical protein